MARVVKVNLLLEAVKYIRGARDAEKATDDLADGLDDVARTSDKTTKSTEKLGGGLDHLARDAKHLDAQIKQSKQGIRDLAREIATTGDEAKRFELTKKLGLEQRGQRKLIKLRDLIDFDDNGGEEAARGFVARFGAKIGPMMASAPIGPGAAAAGTALAAAMAPTLGAGLAGAVVGGAAGAGIVGGALLAARDPRVKAAGTALGAFILGDLEKRASAFVPVMLDSIGDVRSAWASMGSDLSRIFASSRLVDPLVNGALSGVRKVVAGVADLVDNADPVTNALAMSFDRLGDAVGDTLTTLSQDADEGASALNDLTVATANLIRVAGGLVHVAANVKGYTDELDVALDKGRYWVEENSYLAETFRHFGGQLDLTADGFKAGSVEAEAYRAATLGTAEAADFAVLKAAGMTDAELAAADASGTYRAKADEAADATGRTAASFQTGVQSVEEFTAKLEDLNGALFDHVDQNLSAEQANIRLEEAIDDAAKAAKNGADKGIDPNTKAGRENRQALLGIAEAANGSAKAILTQTGSQELASAATERGRAKFLKAADAMGVSKTKAKELADKLFGIPSVKPTVTVTTKQTPIDLKTVAGRIAAIKSKQVVISVHNKIVTTRSEGRTVGIGDGIGGRRWGGVTEHAQWGVLREAHIASPVATARYAYAEQATGGEAFIPRKGDMARSRSIWSHVGENWLGMRPALQPAGGGTTVVRSLHVTVNVPATVNKAEVGREVVEAVKAYEKSSGKGWRS